MALARADRFAAGPLTNLSPQVRGEGYFSGD
jgi:hypothetical protein